MQQPAPRSGNDVHRLLMRASNKSGTGPRLRGCAREPQRNDYYDSPEAPKANSLVPSVNVVVVNDAGEILLIRRTDNDNNWAVPGGAVDLGESITQAAVRETLEESGIECAITGIVGIYSDPST
jgi:hypothetical protein